jgi:hypothetical protein
VSEEQVFKVRRSDGIWYAGRREDRSPTWTAAAQDAYRFTRWQVASGVVRWLRYLGFEVQVVGGDG